MMLLLLSNMNFLYLCLFGFYPINASVDLPNCDSKQNFFKSQPRVSQNLQKCFQNMKECKTGLSIDGELYGLLS